MKLNPLSTRAIELMDAWKHADGILTSYDEIILKSHAVRRRFEKKLVQNMKLALDRAGILHGGLKRGGGRIFVEVEDVERALYVLRRIFGISWLAPAYRLRTTKIEEILKFCRENHGNWISEGKTFAVRARRVGVKEYNSIELAKQVGKVIERNVDLKSPDVEIFVEARGDQTYVYSLKIKGPGGLPLGTQGSVVALISGGIDSPVAAWMLMKRGASIIALYAHSGISRDSFMRFIEVMKVLKEWHVGEQIRAFVYRESYDVSLLRPDEIKYAYILERRIMLRVANALAERLRAKAIVTGEDLGQVSSQTLDNIATIDEASKLPVLRPLIGMNKLEIVNLAKSIGTYEVSIRKVTSECGTLPICVKKPATKAKLERIKEIEEKLDIDRAVERALSSLEDVTRFIQS